MTERQKPARRKRKGPARAAGDSMRHLSRDQLCALITGTYLERLMKYNDQDLSEAFAIFYPRGQLRKTRKGYVVLTGQE